MIPRNVHFEFVHSEVARQNKLCNKGDFSGVQMIHLENTQNIANDYLFDSFGEELITVVFKCVYFKILSYDNFTMLSFSFFFFGDLL